MYKLTYDDSNNEITAIDPNGNRRIVTNDFPSEPIFSPDQKKAAYIAPLEWECLGSLYLFNLETGENKEILSADHQNQYTPKYSIWLNNEELAVVIGFGMGTVAVGGNVFKMKIEDGNLFPITNFKSDIQITKLVIREDYLVLQGIRYIDDNYNEFKEYSEEISMKDLR